VLDPKREALRVAEQELATQEGSLREARKVLASINGKIKVGGAAFSQRLVGQQI